LVVVTPLTAANGRTEPDEYIAEVDWNSVTGLFTRAEPSEEMMVRLFHDELWSICPAPPMETDLKVVDDVWYSLCPVAINIVEQLKTKISNINLIVFIVVLFFRLFNITYSLHVLVYL
jgi:hypothetical protein